MTVSCIVRAQRLWNTGVGESDGLAETDDHETDMMADDLIRYDVLAQEAMRGVMRKVLSEVEKTDDFLKRFEVDPEA